MTNSIFFSGLGEPEGPVLLPDGRWGVVEMSPDTGHVSLIASDGSGKKLLVQTGRPNGMLLDPAGFLWVAESVNPPALLKVDLEGNVEIMLTSVDGQDFLFPNDLVLGPDGAIYMTDSGVFRPDFMKLAPSDRPNYDFDGRVYRIDPSDMSIKILDSGLKFANGIGFGLDNSLFVTTTGDGLVWRYDWSENGSLSNKRQFADLVDHAKPPLREGFVGGDGFAVASDGSIYSAVVGQGDVTVVSKEGDVTSRIPVAGAEPTNVAFGASGSESIFVTVKDTGLLQRFEVGIDGL
jgi:gluconolactonase